jgi:hypothetical protein|tara:strand:- start:105 stop:941 length:837 start_codon:yes stop_codon:yes gene_type:complete
MNEVAKKKKSEISTNVVDFTSPSMVGAGFENVNASELAIPFLKIASSQTPEVKKGNTKHVEGLEEGMIFNSVTKEFYNGIMTVPCFFRSRFVEWEKLGEGTGAPVKIYTPEDVPPLTRSEHDGEDHYMINGQLSKTYVVRTAEYFVLRLNDDGSFERAQIIMQKTQYKKSRYWNTMMMNQKTNRKDGTLVTLPVFANVYNMKAVREANKKNDWWGWNIKLEKSVNGYPNPKNIVEEAQNFYKLVVSGEIDPSPEVINESENSEMKNITPTKEDAILGS